jgi:hypothetical protein
VALVQGLIEGLDRDQVLGMMEQNALYYHASATDDRVLFVGDGLLDESYAGVPAPPRVIPPRASDVIP